MFGFQESDDQSEVSGFNNSLSTLLVDHCGRLWLHQWSLKMNLYMYDFSDFFVEKRSFCKSRAEIKILLFSSELGTHLTQGYPVIVNLWLLENDRTAQVCSAIVEEEHQASEFHYLLTKITERLIKFLETLPFGLYIHKLTQTKYWNTTCLDVIFIS